LRSLLIAVLLFASAGTLYWNWEPWMQTGVLNLRRPDSASNIWKVPSIVRPQALFALNGSRLVTKDCFGITQVWDAKSGLELYGPKWDPIQYLHVSMSADRAIICEWGRSNLINLWDFKNDKDLTFACSAKYNGYPLEFSTDGTSIIVPNFPDNTARIFKINTGEEIVLKGHSAPVYIASWSPDGRFVATGSEDHSARIWDPETGKSLCVLNGHTDFVVKLAFSHNGERVATYSFDQTCRLWSVTTGNEIAKIPKGVMGDDASTFSKDSIQLYTLGGQQGWAWNTETGKEILKFEQTNDAIAVIGPVVSPDGTRMVCFGSDDGVRIFDTNSGTKVNDLDRAPGTKMQCVYDFSEQGLIATAGAINAARIWSLDTGNLLAELGGHKTRVTSVAFSPDGEQFVTATEGNCVHIWSRRRSERHGVFWLPEFWLTIFLVFALVWSVRRERRLRADWKSLSI
jgi:WD40 repeat protein